MTRANVCECLLRGINRSYANYTKKPPFLRKRRLKSGKFSAEDCGISFFGFFFTRCGGLLFRCEFVQKRDDGADADDGDDGLGDHVRRVVARGVGEDRFDGGVRRVLSPDGGAADEVADVADGTDHDGTDRSRGVRVFDDSLEHAAEAEEREGHEVVREHQDDVGEDALDVTEVADAADEDLQDAVSESGREAPGNAEDPADRQDGDLAEECHAAAEGELHDRNDAEHRGQCHHDGAEDQLEGPVVQVDTCFVCHRNTSFPTQALP